MPTYEYRCTSCGHRFDVSQRLDELPLQLCERCGGALRKVFHPAGIVFKGSGFYATDSRRPAKAGAPAGEKAADKGSPTSSGASDSSSGSSDSSSGSSSSSSTSSRASPET